ncbi:MAG TPA: response regulator [Myxococcales bacterium]|jgi:DNA-binding response OmpR family regulator
MAQILLLDDDAAVCDLVPAFLQDLHTVTVVSNWTEITRQIFHHDFDLVLLDVNLPVVSGDKIAEVLRKTTTKPLNIALFSSMDEEALSKLADTVGANGYIVKTLEKRVLRSRISKFLEPRAG